MPWGRVRLWFSIFWRWIATSIVAGATCFITEGYLNNLDDEAPGDAWFVGSDTDVVLLGLILGVVLGGALGVVSGVVAATLGAILLVPYKGKRASFTTALGLATGIAAAVTVLLLTVPDWNDTPPTMPTVLAALVIVTTSPWLVAGYVSWAEVKLGTDGPS